ncbi:tRNA lysidine(34) synthetase TilS [Sutcliffiella cohnii]
MKEKVLTFIKKHKLLKSGKTVVVGVSGGMDSVCLLHLLKSIQLNRNITIVCAHVDHMFRGKESEEDLHFVKALCEQWDIPFESAQVNVTDFMKKQKMSSQTAARECRYHFFKEVMEKYKADYLALGHHGDDQIETMLMRFGRGAVSLGYAGIQPFRPFANGFLIRPLLCVDKEEIEKYINDENLPFRTDPSNNENAYTRNRIRHFVLPSLKAEFPTVHEKFQTFSERLTEDELYLQELTHQKMNKVMKSNDVGSVKVDRNEFCLLAKPLQRRGIQLILKYLYNNEIPPALSSIHINNLLSLLTSEHPSGSLDFPNGLTVKRSYNECLFTFEKESIQPYALTVNVPGKIILPRGDEVNCEVLAEYKKDIRKSSNKAIIDLTHVTLPLIVRSRIFGDRIQLKGMVGSKKVKNIFIDHKVPLHERDCWPIITDENGNILWVPMLARSIYEAKEDTGGPVLLITWKSSRSLGGNC